MGNILAGLPVFVAGAISVFLYFNPGVMPENIAEAFKEGGWGMNLILWSFLVGLWLIVDRTIMVLKTTFDARGYGQNMRQLLLAGKVQEAEQLSAQINKPLTRIMAAGLAKSSAGQDAMLAAMDQQAYAEVPAIEKRTGYLALMGNAATLMGLFGTIVGLIHSFGAVGGGSAEGKDNATQLAAGIAEAMNCTAFGLLTGVTALVAFSILNGRTQGLLDEINFYSLRLYRSWKRGQQQLTTPEAARKPIAAPHPHLMSHVGLLKGGGGHGKKSTFASLQLTPLIDMFIVMVIFLLMSFSASGEIVTANKDVKLPFAQNVEKLKRVPVVTISFPEGDAANGIITLEGEEVATTQELLDDVSEDNKIAKLTNKLEAKKNAWKDQTPDKPFPGELIIQCDQKISFKILKKVMYSAGIAGYANLLFAVQERSKSGEG